MDMQIAQKTDGGPGSTGELDLTAQSSNLASSGYILESSGGAVGRGESGISARTTPGENWDESDTDEDVGDADAADTHDEVDV